MTKLTDKQFRKYCELVYREAGINPTAEKRELLNARLAKRLRKTGIEAGAYFELIQTDGDESDLTFTCMIRYVHEKYQDKQQLFNHGVVFIGMDAETQLFLWKYFQKSAALQSVESS